MTTRFHLRPPVEDMVFQLYGRPLHPELFDILASRRIRHRNFLLDLWITATGHVIAWQGRCTQLTELAATGSELPAWGHLLNHRLRGQRCDTVGTLPGVKYQASFQVEVLPADQFLTFHREIISTDVNRQGLVYAFAPNHRWALTPVSAVYVESRDGCLSMSAFHTFPDEGAVVKTQSLIERR